MWLEFRPYSTKNVAESLAVALQLRGDKNKNEVDSSPGGDGSTPGLDHAWGIVGLACERFLQQCCRTELWNSKLEHGREGGKRRTLSTCCRIDSEIAVARYAHYGHWLGWWSWMEIGGVLIELVALRNGLRMRLRWASMVRSNCWTIEQSYRKDVGWAWTLKLCIGLWLRIGQAS